MSITAPTSSFSLQDALGVAGIGAASAASYFGQKRANKHNEKLARENRDWQERMSNTSYTRAVADLKNAGLNPLLAVGAQASTPGGNVAQVENAAGKGASSALEAQRIHRENMAVDAQIKNLQANTNLTDAKTLTEAASAQNLVGSILDSTKNWDPAGLVTRINKNRLAGVNSAKKGSAIPNLIAALKSTTNMRYSH